MSDTNVAPLRAEDVLRDVGYPGFVASLFNRSGDRAKDWAHAALGVATETQELIVAEDAVHGLEEQGDLTFYAQAVINLTEEFTGAPFDYELCERLYFDMAARADEIGIDAVINEVRTQVLDDAKRLVGYGKDPKLGLSHAGALSVALAQIAMAVAKFSDTDSRKVELANVAKLLDRYKGLKFDADRAVNRDVASERRTLEAAA